ncbi:MAG: AI-2E family transporter, partial [Burkholderiaceae bacterium]
SGVLGGIVNVLIIIFVGLYLAAEPRLYTNGLVRLVPIRHRPRAQEFLSALGHTLRWWLVGRLSLMLLNGVLTALALWLLGVPLALTLGILAGLLNFIPNIGPVIAGVPAVLIALMQSPQQALYVFILYVALQSVDGYVLTPLVQRRTIELPPVLTITAQVLLGVLLGTLGVLLATPLTAAALVLVKMLYVEDTLGDSETTSTARASRSG